MFPWNIKPSLLIASAVVLSGLWSSGSVAAQGDTWTVTKTEDSMDGVCDSDCSLREAIDAADPGDTIDIPAGTCTLTQSSSLAIVNNSGEAFTDPLVLSGAGADSTIIEAADRANVATFSVFFVGSGTNVTISGVTFRYGNQTNGGGENLGTLTLANSTVTQNTADHGGGIWNQDGNLTIVNSTLSRNASNETGGGMENLEGIVTLMDSTVSVNMADDSGGGIFNNGRLTATNTTITDKIAVSGGGDTSSGGRHHELRQADPHQQHRDQQQSGQGERESPPLPEPKRAFRTAS